MSLAIAVTGTLNWLRDNNAPEHRRVLATTRIANAVPSALEKEPAKCVAAAQALLANAAALGLPQDHVTALTAALNRAQIPPVAPSLPPADPAPPIDRLGLGFTLLGFLLGAVGLWLGFAGCVDPQRAGAAEIVTTVGLVVLGIGVFLLIARQHGFAVVVSAASGFITLTMVSAAVAGVIARIEPTAVDACGNCPPDPRCRPPESTEEPPEEGTVAAAIEELSGRIAAAPVGHPCSGRWRRSDSVPETVEVRPDGTVTKNDREGRSTACDSLEACELRCTNGLLLEEGVPWVR